MSLFRRRSSLFGGRSCFGRGHAVDRDPLVGRSGYGGYHSMLTPPSMLAFVVSIVLAGAAVLFRYANVDVPAVTSANVFNVLAIAYAVLLAGVLLPRL